MPPGWGPGGMTPPVHGEGGSAAADERSTRRSPDAFAHSSERELARILDFYRVAWKYEPRSFPLRWHGEQVVEMFTPDFYLPELDLYVELTTLRQRLVTKKNRKLRLLRELYPDVSIVLIYKRDYHDLLAKLGYGAADVPPPHLEGVLEEAERILFTAAQVQAAAQ